jgi:hypothetical protein
MERRSNALVAFWADIEPSYVERYRQWHTEEHIPERVAIPGFDTGRRYARVDGGRMFFMYYDTASPEVLKSDAYLHALNHPTPWTTESLRYFRNPLRNLYRLLQEQGAAPGRASDFVRPTLRSRSWTRRCRKAYIGPDCSRSTRPRLA